MLQTLSCKKTLPMSSYYHHPSTGQVRPAVMRCAKQRDCAPVHILPYLSSHVHMFLEVIFILCKCVLSFHIRKAPHIIVRCLFYYIPINIDTREMNPIIMSPTAIAHPHVPSSDACCFWRLYGGFFPNHPLTMP